jgi:hypothetical protein
VENGSIRITLASTSRRIIMPMGPSPAGFAYFVGIKFLGYSAYAQRLRRKFDDHPNQGVALTLKIGGLRTVIGIVVGLSYGFLLGTANIPTWVFFLGLLPIRLCEWLLLLRLAFKEKIQNKRLTAYSVTIGTVVSYILDVVAIAAALVLPGGIWVC